MRNTVIAQTVIVTLVAAILAGCGAPTPGAEMAVRTVKASAKAAPVAVASSTAAMDLDDELESFDVLATGASGFGILALKAAPAKKAAGPQKAKPAQKADLRAKTARRDADHREQVMLRLQKKVDLSKRAQQLKAIPWVDNGDGTQSKQGTLKSPGRAGGEMTITIDLMVESETNAVMHSLISASGKTARGGTTDTVREKTLQGDGSYLIVLQSESHGAKGASLVMDGTRTVSADGDLAGGFTFTATDAKGKVKTESFLISGTVKRPVVKRAVLPVFGAPVAPIDPIDAPVIDLPAPQEVPAEDGGAVDADALEIALTF